MDSTSLINNCNGGLLSEKIIIDTDPGIDDAMTIMMAFQTPNLEILGLTTTFGNVSTKDATRNALILCEITGRSSIPVAEGSSEPLKRPDLIMPVMSSDTNRRWWWRKSELWKVVSVLLLGQCVSFVLAILNFTSSLSANLGANSPVTLGFCGYLALTLIYGSNLLYQRHKFIISWYWYALIAFFDVQGNYLFNSAYYFTSITSVALLDCWTIAWVILLTWIFLGTKYSLWQFLGASICGVGLCLVFLSDVGVGGGGGSNPVLGDILVIGATFFFALSNVGQEFCAKNNCLLELLAMLGLFGMLFSVIEIAIFERENLEEVIWSAELILTFVGYTVGFITFYTLTPLMLQASGATLFNLSLLTDDMWAVVIRIFFYHQHVDWLYYVSFSIVGVGLFIYSKTEKSRDLSLEPENEIPNQQYQLVHEQGVESQDADSLSHSSL